MYKLLLLIGMLALAAPGQVSELQRVFGSGARSATIPTSRSVLGFELGERPTTPDEVLRLAQAIDAASDRVQLVEVGRSAGGRVLLHALISTPENLERMVAIADEHRRMLASGTEASSDLPVHVFLGMSVHGNEPSGVEAGLALLWHLASSDEAATEITLKGAMIEIALDMNPDGRARYVHGLRERGQWEAETRAGSYALSEPWPGGRGNGNWFDMNRDWHLQTQPESRARVARCVAHPPQVIADFHEMGSDDGYYAGIPAGPPRNMLQTAEVAASLQIVGAAIVAAQEARGTTLWTGDRFPADYPGYGGSWGSFSGAATLTLEQAGAGAGRVRRSDGSVLTFAETAANHAAAALAIVSSSAAQRSMIHANFAAHSRRVSAAAAQLAEPLFVFADGSEPSATQRLAVTLQRNGIRVEQLADAVHVEARLSGHQREARSFPAGSLVVDLRQARSPLVLSLLDPEVPVDPEFLQAELKRHAHGENPERYDWCTWNMPGLLGVEAWRCGAVAPNLLRAWEVTAPDPALAVSAPIAWVSRDGGEHSIAQAIQLVRQGVRLRHAPFEFIAEGMAYPTGTLVALAERNPDASQRALLQAAVAKGWMRPLRTAITEQGQDAGSWRTRALVDPRVVLLVGEGTDAPSAGAVGWVLHGEAGLSVVRARSSALERALEEANVLVLPDGSYATGLPKAALQGFLARRGVIVALAGGVKALASKEVGLLELKEAKATKSAPRFAGSVVRLESVKDSWLTCGVSPSARWMLRGDALYAAPEAESGTKVLVSAAELSRPEDEVSAGMNARGLPLLLEVVSGRGRIIAFCSDPCLRGANGSAWRALLNAVLLGPAMNQ